MGETGIKIWTRTDFGGAEFKLGDMKKKSKKKEIQDFI